MTVEPGSIHIAVTDVGHQTKLYMHDGEVMITIACTAERVTWIGRVGLESLRREEHDAIMASMWPMAVRPC